MNKIFILLYIFCLNSSVIYAESKKLQPKFEPSACSQLPELKKVLSNARCGFLVVPENRTQTNGRTIRLAVAIIPSKKPNPAKDPIVHLAGGPGGSAIFDAPFIISSGLNRNHDVILLAQRGTFLSEPALTCPEVDRFNQRAIGLKYDADSTKRLHLEATRACYNRLIAKGIDLSAYNTIESAADLEDLRKALKIQKLNVYAYSYGTDLALNLMHLHPKGIRAVIIDSVLPPDIGNLSETWDSVQEAFNNMFNACASDSICRTRYPKLVHTFTKLVQKLENTPEVTTVKFPKTKTPVKVMIDGGALVNWLVGAQRPLTDIPLKIKALDNGNPKKIASDIALIVDPKSTPVGQAGLGLAFSIFCSEWVPYEMASEILVKGKRNFPNYPDSVLAQAPQLPFMRDDCEIWKVQKAPSTVRELTRSAIPTLILSGSFDAKTSPKAGDHVAHLLKKATHVVIPGEGHRVADTSPCTKNIIDSFLKDPSTSPDTSCVDHIKPPAFL